MAQQADAPGQSPELLNPQPRSYQQPLTSNAASTEFNRQRSSSSVSPTRREDSVRRPGITEAVNSVVTQSNPPATIHPELVSRITEEVINTLQASGFTLPTQPPSSQPPAPAEATDNGPPLDGLAFPNASAPVHSASTSHTSNPPTAQATLRTARAESQSTNEPVLLTPQTSENEASPPSVHSSLVPQTYDGYSDTKRRSVTSEQSDSVNSKPSSDPQRPSPPPRVPTDSKTLVEKAWQPLFDSDGFPTQRLGRFLRGIAKHIIEDFEPARSLVISPQKMLRFYDITKLSDEIYPWHALFGGTMTYSSLSHLYRDLKCEHHFVQLNQSEKPCVPALTPDGFETWMTHAIRAYPELEFQRFAKVALHMPISNADDPKERFPKELSRRLFPSKADAEIAFDLEDAILADPIIELTPYGLKQQRTTVDFPPMHPSANSSQYSYPPPQTQAPLPSNPTQTTQPLKQTISAPSQKTPVDTGKPLTLANPAGSRTGDNQSQGIERERKPYSAQPGGGKVYDMPEESNVASSRRRSASHYRANSTATGTKLTAAPHDDQYLKPRARGSSVAAGTYGNRTVSPSRSEYARSEPDPQFGLYGNINARMMPQDMQNNGLYQSVSWNEPARRYNPQDYANPPPPNRITNGNYAGTNDTQRRQPPYGSYPPPSNRG